MGVQVALRKAGCRSLKLYVNGVEIVRRKPGLGAGLVAELAAKLEVRCVVDAQGVGVVCPRPYCTFVPQGLFINGQLFDPTFSDLDDFRLAWPSLGAELGRRFGGFTCGGHDA